MFVVIGNDGFDGLQTRGSGRVLPARERQSAQVLQTQTLGEQRQVWYYNIAPRHRVRVRMCIFVQNLLTECVKRCGTCLEALLMKFTNSPNNSSSKLEHSPAPISHNNFFFFFFFLSYYYKSITSIM